MTSRTVFSLALAALLGLGAPYGVQARESAVVSAEDTRRIADIQRSLSFLGSRADQLWPGFALKAIPFVLHQPDGPAYLLQHPTPLPRGFAPLPGQPGIGLQPVAQGYPHGIDTDFPLGHRKAVTVMVDSDSTWRQALLIAVHEAFHHYQHSRDFPLRGSSTDLGVQSARDMALAEVEQHLLAEALNTPSNPRAQELARMFLAVRETRHRALTEAFIQSEATLEALEGTAHYVEQRARIVASASYPFGRSLKEVLEDLSRSLRSPLNEETFGRARYYETGAAMGFLLDRWMAGWPRHAERDQTPAELLTQASGYRSPQRAGLLRMVESRFNLKALTNRHQTAVDALKGRQDALLDAFERQAGRRVLVEIAFEHGGISASSQGASFPLPDDQEYTETATVSLETRTGTRVLLRGTILSGPLVEGESGFYTYTLYLPVQPGDLMLNGRPVPADPGRYQGALRWVSDRATVESPRATVEVTPTGLRIRV